MNLKLSKILMVNQTEPINNQDFNNQIQKPKLSIFPLFLMFIFGLFIGAVFMALMFNLYPNTFNFSSNQENIDQQENEIKTGEQDSVVPPITDNNQEVKDKVFTHKDLGDFSFSYPETWNVKVDKAFGTRVNASYNGTYFPKCSVENCMAVELSNGSYKLGLIFDIIFDDMGTKCSNTVTYQKLANLIYRIKDSKGYIYTSSVNLNYKDTFGYPSGKISDEWSAVDNNKYNICIAGSGQMIGGKSEYLGKNEGGILLEHITADLNTPETILKELDMILGSIKK